MLEFLGLREVVQVIVGGLYCTACRAKTAPTDDGMRKLSFERPDLNKLLQQDEPGVVVIGKPVLEPEPVGKSPAEEEAAPTASQVEKILTEVANSIHATGEDAPAGRMQVVHFHDTASELGVSILEREGHIFLQTVDSGSAAAGVPVGAQVVAINEDSTDGKSINEVVTQLRELRACGAAFTVTFVAPPSAADSSVNNDSGAEAATEAPVEVDDKVDAPAESPTTEPTATPPKPKRPSLAKKLTAKLSPRKQAAKMGAEQRR